MVEISHNLLNGEPDLITANIVLKSIMEWEKTHRKQIDVSYKKAMAELYDISEAIANLEVVYSRIDRLENTLKSLIEPFLKGQEIPWSN